MRAVKNLIGRLLGYPTCPITGDTYWRTEVKSVHYSPTGKIKVSSRALRDFTREEIAHAAFEEGQRHRQNHLGERFYTFDQILANISRKDPYSPTLARNGLRRPA